MDQLNELPSLPADPRLGAPSVREPFVDEAVVQTFMQPHAQWQEQCYFGDDFAGRDDYGMKSDEPLALPMSPQVGAVFAPIHASIDEPAPAIFFLQQANAPEIQGAGNRQRTLAMVAACVVLFATAMTGLWAADVFAPATPSKRSPKPVANTLEAKEIEETPEPR